MTSQSPDALRRAMAEGVMGWEVLIPESSPDLICYGRRMKDGLAEFIIPQADWHPDTDIAQCFQYIVPRMHKGGWYLRGLSYNPYTKKWTALFYKFTDDGDFSGEAVADTASAVICLAAEAAWEQGVTT